MFFRRPDINFATDDAHRFLPWLMAIMVGLAALFLCVGFSIDGWVVGQGERYSGSFTVNVPAGENQKERADKARTALSKISGIAGVTEMESARLKALVAPWMGNTSLDELPLPIVLEVTLSNAASKVNYSALEKNLSLVSPGVEVDAQERWMESFSKFSSALQGVITILAVLVIIVMSMTMALYARASLKLHGRAVSLLHTIGAEDGYIARQFQNEAMRQVFPGALVGVLTAAVLYAALGAYIQSLEISLLPPLAMAWPHFWLVILMPVACALAAGFVTSISIRAQLQRVL